MNKLVISLVTWNSEKLLKDCLESVIRQTYKDFKLFIFDNYSTDNTISIVNDFLDTRFNLIRNNKNIGYCGGHNYVINNTDSEYVLLLNPDIILDDYYIELALKKIANYNDVGTLCGLLLQNKDNEIIDSAGMNRTVDLRYSLRYHGKKCNEVLLKESFVDGADGALPLYSRKMIDDVKINANFFDEMFFAHKEDWDISWRSQKFGWQTLFSPECIAIHPREFKPSNLDIRKRLNKDIKYHAIKNQYILVIKNIKISKNYFNLFLFLIRQIIVFVYVILNERKSLHSYEFILFNLNKIFKERRQLQDKLNKLKIDNTLHKLHDL